MGERRTGSDNMNSLMTEIWRCTKIAKEKGQNIKIHMNPLTTYNVIRELDGIEHKAFDFPVVVDIDIADDNFWIEVVK